jgi:hypothetical protein
VSRILTPDQTLRVFVSSTLQELAPERLAAQKAERAGDDLLVVMAETNFADYSFAIGDPETSRRHVERALELLDVTGVRYAAADTLESLARIEAADGDHIRAVELVGTAAAVRETMHAPLWGPLAERHSRFVDELRTELGDGPFDDALERGLATPLDHWLASAYRTA